MQIKGLLCVIPLIFLAIPLLFITTLRLEENLTHLNDVTEDTVPQLIDKSREKELSIKEFLDEPLQTTVESDQSHEVNEETGGASNPDKLPTQRKGEGDSLHELPADTDADSNASSEDAGAKADTKTEGDSLHELPADTDADSNDSSEDAGAKTDNKEKNALNEMPPGDEFPLAPTLGEVNFNGIDFTLATQTSPDRSWLLKEDCRRWSGPIVAVLAYKFNAIVNQTEVDELRSDKRCRKLTILEYHATEDETEFPVNKLRNLAIKAVTTSHYILLDIDFLPSKDLYRHLIYMTKRTDFSEIFHNPKAALTLPAFELKSRCSSVRECRKQLPEIPTDKGEITDCVRDRICNVFDPWNPQGHSTTNFMKWFRSKEVSLRKIICFDSNRYEPYLIIQKHKDLPLYDERFKGYGKNKIQHVLHLRYSGYIFYVVSRHFLVHSPHPKSKSRHHWEKSNHRLEMDRLFSKFLKALQQRPTNDIATHLCRYQDKVGVK